MKKGICLTCLLSMLLYSCTSQAQSTLTTIENNKVKNKVYISTENEENLIPFHNAAGQWGYLDAKTDTVVIPPKYDRVALFQRGVAEVFMRNPHPKNYYQQELIGFINTKGEEIFPPQFTGVYEVEIHGNRVTADDLFYLKSVSTKDGASGVINLETGQWLIKMKKDKRIAFYDCHHFVVGRQVFYFGDNKLSLPNRLKIDWINFSPNFIEVKNKMEATGLYTWEGEKIIPANYLDIAIDSASKRIVASKLKGGTTIGTLRRIIKSGNEEGENIVVDLYDFNGDKIASYSAQYQAMLEDGGVGSFQIGTQTTYFSLIDGKILSDREKVMDTIAGGYELFRKNEQVGLRTTGGKIIIPSKYRWIHFIDSTHIVAETNDLHHIVYNLQGKKMFDDVCFQLQYLPKLKRFMVSKDGKAGQIDMSGNVIIPLAYSGFSSLSLMEQPPYAVYKDGKHGIIDGKGKTIVPFIYSYLSDSRILAKTDVPYFVVAKDEHYGLLNKNGHWILPMEYGFVSIDEDDHWVHLEAFPRNKNVYGRYNLKTGALIPPKYNIIRTYPDCIIVANRKDNNYYYQLLSVKGAPLTDNHYTKMEFKNGYLLCVRNKKYGLLDTNGKVLIPFDYQRMLPRGKTLLLVEQNGGYFYMNVNGKKYKMPKKVH